MTGWEAALLVYLVLAIVSFAPVLWAIAVKVPLKPGGPGFEESLHFSDAGKRRLIENYERMGGTLFYWKNAARRYKAMHLYSVIWASIDAVLIVFLSQAITDDPSSSWLLTAVGGHSALLFSVSRALKVESNHRAFREGESDFYDLRRRFLDRPASFGATETQQIDSYFEQVEIARRVVRSAETDNMPSLEEIGRSSSPSSAATS